MSRESRPLLPRLDTLPPDLDLLHPISRMELGIPGPYSPHELWFLQGYLQAQAQMDNVGLLAQSPLVQAYPGLLGS